MEDYVLGFMSGLYFIICFFWAIYTMQNQYKIYNSSVGKLIFIGIVNLIFAPIAIIFAVINFSKHN